MGHWTPTGAEPKAYDDDDYDSIAQRFLHLWSRECPSILSGVLLSYFRLRVQFSILFRNQSTRIRTVDCPEQLTELTAHINLRSACQGEFAFPFAHTSKGQLSRVDSWNDHPSDLHAALSSSAVLKLWSTDHQWSAAICLVVREQGDGPTLPGVGTPRVRIQTYDAVLLEYILAMLLC